MGDKKKKCMREIRRMVRAADTNGNGIVSLAEFSCCVEDEDCLEMFRGLNVEKHEVPKIFKLLDYDDDDNVFIDEFITGCMLLKSGATPIDLAMFLFENRRFVSEFRRFRDFVERKLGPGPGGALP